MYQLQTRKIKSESELREMMAFKPAYDYYNIEFNYLLKPHTTESEFYCMEIKAEPTVMIDAKMDDGNSFLYIQEVKRDNDDMLKYCIYFSKLEMNKKYKVDMYVYDKSQNSKIGFTKFFLTRTGSDLAKLNVPMYDTPVSSISLVSALDKSSAIVLRKRPGEANLVSINYTIADDSVECLTKFVSCSNMNKNLPLLVLTQRTLIYKNPLDPDRPYIPEKGVSIAINPYDDTVLIYVLTTSFSEKQNNIANYTYVIINSSYRYQNTDMYNEKLVSFSKSYMSVSNPGVIIHSPLKNRITNTSEQFKFITTQKGATLVLRKENKYMDLESREFPGATIWFTTISFDTSYTLTIILRQKRDEFFVLDYEVNLQ